MSVKVDLEKTRVESVCVEDPAAEGDVQQMVSAPTSATVELWAVVSDLVGAF